MPASTFPGNICHFQGSAWNRHHSRQADQMQILFWGSPKWNLTEANWAVLVGLRQANRAGLSTPYLFSVDAVCQGAHCPAEAQLSCTTGADAQQRCKSHSRAVTATCRCQMKHTHVCSGCSSPECCASTGSCRQLLESSPPWLLTDTQAGLKRLSPSCSLLAAISAI